MDRPYHSQTPSLAAFYPSGFPLMLPSDVLQPRLQHLQTLSLESLRSFSDYDDPNRPMLPSRGPQRTRRRQQQPGSEHVKHRRTRSGCYTCRQRRVKCDEAHPVCDRCRKGKRECTYPGAGSSSTPFKSTRPGLKTKGSPDGSSPSSSDLDADHFASLSAILDVDEDEDDSVEGAVSDGLQLSDAASSIPDSSTSPSIEAAPSSSLSGFARPGESSSSSPRPSTGLDGSQTVGWLSLPRDIRYYLLYHREHISHHHYAFKYSGGSFLKSTFIEIALGEGNAALLYAIVAFAAYHRTVSHNDEKLSIFLSYYNKSIAHLQRLLKHRRHNSVTLLTILQLATIEEFLGDWVNLVGHQKAAYQILTELYTPQTIMLNGTRRQIVNWYFRFDLLAGMMAGEKTTLGREWVAAAADFYRQQTIERAHDLGARFERYFATIRLLAMDVAILFAAQTKNSISDDEFSAGLQQLMAEFGQFGHTIEGAFQEPSCFATSFSRAPPKSDNDVTDYRDPRFLYTGELSTMNFVLLDYWAMVLMFKRQISRATGQAHHPDLVELALRECKMFEAIQYSDDSGPAAILGARASLSVMAIFLPKDEKHTMWCRRKFADMEKLGYVCPASYRTHMSELWGEDVTRWWLPNQEGYLSTLQLIRDFIHYRAPRAMTGSSTSGVRDMSGIFRSLQIAEEEEEEEPEPEEEEEEEEERERNGLFSEDVIFSHGDGGGGGRGKEEEEESCVLSRR